MFNIVLEVLVTNIRQQREIKVFKLAKKTTNCLFTDDMTLYMENPKDSSPKLLELIQEFSNVAGYKVSVQKSVAFLYINNENTEREIRESILFTIAPRTIRYLGINLTKEVKDLYSRNYRTLMKEIEEDTKR